MALNNSQYDTIMREYNRKQLAHENLRLAHVQEVYKNIPRIRVIDETVSSSSAAQAKLQIRRDFSSAEQYKQQIAALKEEKAILLKQHGYPDDYMELTYDCPLCKDTGYVDTAKCRCYLQAATDLLYHQSGLQHVLERENFDTLSYKYYDKDKRSSPDAPTVLENMTKIIDDCKKYVDAFPAKKGNLLFTGKTGLGKTFLSHCIAKAVMDKCCSVVYLTASQLFETLAQYQFDRSEDADSTGQEYIYDTDLLILDDLGTEIPNSFTMSSFFTLINDRLSREKGTIISTNLSKKDLRDLYGERISSRLFGHYDYLEFLGSDIRILKKYRKY